MAIICFVKNTNHTNRPNLSSIRIIRAIRVRKNLFSNSQILDLNL